MRPFLPTAAVVLCLAARAFAQDYQDQGHHNHGHAANHDWYKELKQPGTGYSCCNGEVKAPSGIVISGDCRPTRAYQTADGVWQAMIDGRWVPVPPRVVLKTLAPDGNSHICANRSGYIYCFLGGSPKI